MCFHRALSCHHLWSSDTRHQTLIYSVCAFRPEMSQSFPRFSAHSPGLVYTLPRPWYALVYTQPLALLYAVPGCYTPSPGVSSLPGSPSRPAPTKGKTNMPTYKQIAVPTTISTGRTGPVAICSPLPPPLLSVSQPGGASSDGDRGEDPLDRDICL